MLTDSTNKVLLAYRQRLSGCSVDDHLSLQPLLFLQLEMIRLTNCYGLELWLASTIDIVNFHKPSLPRRWLSLLQAFSFFSSVLLS